MSALELTPASLPIRAIFDCNVFLQAMANPSGPAGACMIAVRTSQIRLFLSRPILAELIEVAARPVLVRKLALSPDRTLAFVDELLSLATTIEQVPAVFAHPMDPKDSMYVDLAIAARANVITSRDQHLLSLRDPLGSAGVDFLSRFASIEILTPVQLLDRLRKPDAS